MGANAPVYEMISWGGAFSLRGFCAILIPIGTLLDNFPGYRQAPRYRQQISSKTVRFGGQHPSDGRHAAGGKRPFRKRSQRPRKEDP